MSDDTIFDDADVVAEVCKIMGLPASARFEDIKVRLELLVSVAKRAGHIRAYILKKETMSATILIDLLGPQLTKLGITEVEAVTYFLGYHEELEIRDAINALETDPRGQGYVRTLINGMKKLLNAVGRQPAA